jgi:6-pyruvoyltetrahydropterin/6-carboxytetrahydropterin synthase
MTEVLLTKRIEFAAAHRYENPIWSVERNRAVFGPCYTDPGHGHNYLLEVTAAGEVDADTGMVLNLSDLKRVLEQVLVQFDHKHFNLDTPYFRERIPTTENIVQVFWELLSGRTEIGRLEKLRLYEDEDLYAEATPDLFGDALPPYARFGRRYHFSAAHRLYTDQISAEENRKRFGPCAGSPPHGHNYVAEVVIVGPINRETGMVIDLQQLDRLVTERIVDRFNVHDLSRDPAFSGGRSPSGENVTRVIWELLVSALPSGRLERVRLVESRETAFEYPSSLARPNSIDFQRQ